MTIITLIGPRAAGKSTAGKLLAKELSCEFIDFDKYMAEILGTNQRGLFVAVENLPDKWSTYFAMCYERLKSLFKHYQRKNVVVDIGGGVVASELPQSQINSQLVRKKSTVFLILPAKRSKENIEILYDREMARKRSNPKYFAGWTKEQILKKVTSDYNVRDVGYRTCSHHIIYTLGESPSETVNKIKEILK